MYGRRIDPKAKVKHLYLPQPKAGVLNAQAFGTCEEIILCESIIDALTLWCGGLRNVSCVYGVNGLTEGVTDCLRDHGTARVLIAYDNDEAGNAAAIKHAVTFNALGCETFRVKLPAGMDVNGYAATKGFDRDAMADLIAASQWIGKGKPPAAGSVPRAAEVVRVVRPPADQPAKEEGEEAAKNKKDSGDAKEEQTEPAAPSEPAASSEPTPQPEPKALVSLAASVSEPVSVGAGAGAGAVEKQPPLASPMPPAPKPVEATVSDHGVVIEIGTRSYRVRGLEKNLAFDVLKLNVMARSGEAFFIDTFDLYAAKARAVFTREAARELGFDPEVIKRDIGKVLLALEGLQEQQIADTLQAKDAAVELSDPDRAAALDLLKQPDLVDRILADFDACGVVGERTNKLVGYLAATSRKLDKPLAVVIQSSSAAGKSSLMDAVLSFIPPEQQVGYSAMTGQSLFYMGGMDLAHKVLSIAEEEGVAQASYALKLLQSEGQLTIASTGKDPGTGRMETQEYHVQGPVMIFLTTTAIDIDEELLNRCVVLSVDENRSQTRAIHNQQRSNETLAGLIGGHRGASLRTLHQNVQRLIRPLRVVNPYARQLDFCDDQARRRRDHMKYLALIRSIALLHQYQRPVRTVSIDDKLVEYIEVTAGDITLANRLADAILGRSIDELPPQTRRLLVELHGLVLSECQAESLDAREYRFTRRFVRERLGWGQTQVKLHVDRLLEMEYVVAHRGGGRRVMYELLYDGRGEGGQPAMCGLIDAEKLTPSSAPADQSSGVAGPSSGQDRPVVGGSSAQGGVSKPNKTPAQTT